MQRVWSGSAPHAARQPRAGLDGGARRVRLHQRVGLGFVWPGRRPAAVNQLREPAQSPGQRRASLDIIIFPLLMHGGPGC